VTCSVPRNPRCWLWWKSCENPSPPLLSLLSPVQLHCDGLGPRRIAVKSLNIMPKVHSSRPSRASRRNQKPAHVKTATALAQARRKRRIATRPAILIMAYFPLSLSTLSPHFVVHFGASPAKFIGKGDKVGETKWRDKVASRYVGCHNENCCHALHWCCLQMTARPSSHSVSGKPT
jgi:hypothetical protein